VRIKVRDLFWNCRLNQKNKNKIMQKMLIAEDDQMLQDIYKMKFSNSGFEVFVAENGKVALEIAKKEKIDIVLTDSIMPEMDGVELIRNLRGGEYDPSMKIIMLSNLSQKEDRDNVMQLGATGFIAKTDFTPAQLVIEVNKIIAA